MGTRKNAIRNGTSVQTSEAMKHILYTDYSKWTQVCFFVYMCQPFWNSHSIHPWEAIRGKAVLTKFCDSVLQKSAKIRTLQADLRKNYPEDETAARSKSYMVSSFVSSHKLSLTIAK